VDPDALGFGAGFLDDTGDSLYLPAYRKRVGTRITSNGLTVRVDLTKNVTDSSAYEKFDLATVGLPHLGWAPGIAAAGGVYYCPVNDESDGGRPHGIFLRYDPSLPFGARAAWTAFDLQENVHREARGYQSIAFKAPWVYLIPFGLGFSELVRYDTTAPFARADSYETFDLSEVHPDARGFTGGIIVGDDLVLVPWRDVTRPFPQQSMSVALRFDTRRPLGDAGAWSSIDLTAVDPRARGYQFGWADQAGRVTLVPTHNAAIAETPPFAVWDSGRPFGAPLAWRTYPSQGVPPSTGAAHDGGGRAWLAPYGNPQVPQDRITRVTATA
jgi:hypothetical protein